MTDKKNAPQWWEMLGTVVHQVGCACGPCMTKRIAAIKAGRA